VAVAADPEASHDARLAAACWRVQAAVEALTEGGTEHLTPLDHPTATEPALAHLHGLERALAELAHPLRTPSGSPLVGA
ncbi:FUSC family protein, partial [Streptomyces bobili]